ncbi:zinc finger protein 85-like [Vanessa tameamea]|uniref:Zinc finger protein 85-like n=1 Tax=Vanessa tameamea TaxID=334116 RepID=A0A8B8HKG7_VANTA
MEFQNTKSCEFDETSEMVLSDDLNIKEEITHEITVDIKPENDDSYSNDDNPFENIQVEIKQEFITPNYPDKLLEISSITKKREAELQHTVMQIENEINELILPNTDDNIKMEKQDEVMGYEYSTIDEGSMDSEEAHALNNVEACLQDEINIKPENDVYEDPTKEEFDKIIKEEMDLTVTETHLISNKVINTTSTITNPQDGVIQSQTTKTLVMEIHPMVQGINVSSLGRINNPEEILPTSHCNDDNLTMEYDDFQLNSITGNVLSLEQEAYGLLKAGRCDVNDKRFSCNKCDKSYKKSKYLKEHMQVHKSIENRAMGIIKGLKTRMENMKKRICNDLKKDANKAIDKHSFENKKARMERLENRSRIKEEVVLNMKKEGYECTCGQIFKRKTRMLSCLRSHDIYADTESCFSCISCTKQFKDKQELALHRKRLHRKRFPCKFCPTDYTTRKDLFKHLQIHQKVQLMEYKVISEVVKGKQKLKCFMCSKTFSELSELKMHVMEDHEEPYICPHCKGTFPKIIDFGNHTKTYHPEVEGQSVLDVLEAFSKLVQAWKCEECKLQFHEADKFAMHQVEKHSPDLKVNDQFQCSDCRRVFVSQKGLTSHRRIHHNTGSTEESETIEKGVMCVECRKICKDMTALTSHMRLHSPERKYPCKFCDFRFSTPEKRKIHAELHTGDMKYVCFICEYQCSSENRLKQHKMSLKHANMKEFLLTGKPLIEEQSTSKESRPEEKYVKKRKQSKSTPSLSGDEGTSTCEVCGDKFPSEKKMLEHKQTHPFIEFPNEDTPTRIFFK